MTPYESARQEIEDIEASIKEMQARILELHRRREHIITKAASEGHLRVRGTLEWAGDSFATPTGA